MADLIVIDANTLSFKGAHYRCAIGKAGFETATRKEGSGTTPTGRFALRECWYRPDRVSPPKTILPLRPITLSDGWCDAPPHPLYNRHVTLPFPASHETLWREDNRYDIIIPLGYNDDPVIPGKGSAIFWHIASESYSTTEGCIAIAQADMLHLLRVIDASTHMVIGI